MPKKPTILSTKTVAKSRLFVIEELELLFSNGEKRIFERLKGLKHGSVMMIPMLDANTVLLIREYAAGVDRYELGLPKGLLEPGEDIFTAANRELKEEIGYGARQLKQLKTMTSAPGYMAANMKLVLASDLYEQQLPGDEPEPIEVVPWQMNNLNELFVRDDFTEARSIAALFWLRELQQTGELA